MGEGENGVFDETSALGRMARVLAKALAISGGMTLVAMVVLVIIGFGAVALGWFG